MNALQSHGEGNHDERTAAMLRRLAVPLIVTGLSPLLLSLADIVVAGRFSPSALASLAVGVVLISIFQMLIQGVALSYRIVAASLVRPKDRARENRLFRHVLVYGLVFAAASDVILLAFAAPAVSLFASDRSIADAAASWLRIRSFGLIPYVIICLSSARLQVHLMAWWSTVVSISSNVVNVLVTYLLVYGRSGLPRMGIAGSATASVLVETAAALIFVGVLRQSTQIASGAVVDSNPGRSDVAAFARVLAPETGSILSLFLSEAVYMWMISTLGSNELAAGQIMVEVLGLAFSLSLGFGTSVQIIEGRAGPNVPRRVWTLPYVYGAMLATVIGGALFAAREQVSSLFTVSSDVVDLSSKALVQVAAILPLIFVSSILAGSLRARGASDEVFLSNLVATWLFQIGGAGVLVFALRGGLQGAMLGYTLYYLVKTATLLGALERRRGLVAHTS